MQNSDVETFVVILTKASIKVLIHKNIKREIKGKSSASLIGTNRY